MKLSEAMTLGYPQIEHSNAMWLVEDDPENKPGQCRGCAIGAALFAMGERNIAGVTKGGLTKYWPWTLAFPNIHLVISELFQRVMYGEITIEDLVEFIKSVEPQEETTDGDGVGRQNQGHDGSESTDDRGEAQSVLEGAFTGHL